MHLRCSFYLRRVIWGKTVLKMSLSFYPAGLGITPLPSWQVCNWSISKIQLRSVQKSYNSVRILLRHEDNLDWRHHCGIRSHFNQSNQIRSVFCPVYIIPKPLAVFIYTSPERLRRSFIHSFIRSFLKRFNPSILGQRAPGRGTQIIST